VKKLPGDLAHKLLEASNKFTGTGLDISVDDVATLAGVPRATLYYYFAGKDDLVAFYMQDKLDRVGDALAKALTQEGTVRERLETALTAGLQALAEHPVLCVELPVAMKKRGDYREVLAGIDRVVLAPLRELLNEGRASGELDVADPRTTAIALMGALNMVGMSQVVETGAIDVEGTAPSLVPQLVEGLVKRA
jgi:AcrR family transcriptional regulator